MAANKTDFQIASFASEAEWRHWLDKNHTNSPGVWLRFFKKTSKVKSVTHDQALLIALCYGWIDGQLKGHDAESWLHKFLPRRPRSIWSKRNCELAEGLIASAAMKPAGRKEIESAKSDGRWDRAYDSPGKMKVPDDFLEALSKNQKAKAFFATLNKANIYAITWRLQTAKKPETRAKRMREIVAMLGRSKKFH